jgi:hypothetical protein
MTSCGALPAFFTITTATAATNRRSSVCVAS